MIFDEKETIFYEIRIIDLIISDSLLRFMKGILFNIPDYISYKYIESESQIL